MLDWLLPELAEADNLASYLWEHIAALLRSLS